ncbi:MAG: xanthine dehydrogenase family protein [Pirellulaceae bacterium]|nr:xanthine dehydrogenase family protein molybdopterin-binding subunit [Planctomycetaceae bacterium]HIM29042.1 xanthine dehydrogenase family protein molybdopterin-binding subunit [Planctomycetota bacterium]
MADTKYSWPTREEAQIIGSRRNRLDGMEKSTGAAKYTYDVNLKDQLIARALGSPHAHCTIASIDIKAAEQTPGVVHVEVLRKVGYEIKWQGDLIAVVAAESEAAAAEGVTNVKITYNEMDVFVQDAELELARKAGRTAPAGGKSVTQVEPGDDDDEDEFVEAEIQRLYDASPHKLEGYYGIDAITHCCLEPHGSTVQWKDGKLLAYLSTQNVSGTDEAFATDLDMTSDDVEVRCEYIGGGFGSKFAADYWGVAAARISKETGRPVKFMLSRDQELKNAGNRPSGYLKVRIGADNNGVVQVWDSQHWGTAGVRGGGISQSVIPYVIQPPNYRRKAIGIKTNNGQARAWRAPNHPQACAMTQTAIDDLARVMKKDAFDVFAANLGNVANGKGDVYLAEMKVAAEIIGWKDKYHLHGQGPSKGGVVEGMGLALHMWGGTANSSTCRLVIRSDGSVESSCGTQDLGTGTRTVCAMVLAETFGLDLDDVTVNIGSSKYPMSGASGGSTTVGAVSESHRRAAQDALQILFEKVAGQLSAKPEELVAVNGAIHVAGDKKRMISWKAACSRLGVQSIEVSASHKRGDASPLSNSGVCGVQMAEVAVDTETGVVKIKKFVAVQDQGLVISPKTCESQIYGAVIMGIAAALYEQRISDPATGAFVNAELSDYKLARLGDVGEIIVELYEPESERQRGVIGNGEPPAISPVAAVSNAICNALGVRVPVAPYTPQRVLEALQGRA